MSSPFDVFDWKYGLTKVSVTSGYTDSSGNFIEEVTVESVIKGNVSDITEKDLAFIDPALVAKGARKISVDSSYGLIVGDRIKITEVSGSITTWTVHTKQHGSNLMSKYAKVSRDTFLLTRII